MNFLRSQILSITSYCRYVIPQKSHRHPALREQGSFKTIGGTWCKDNLFLGLHKMFARFFDHAQQNLLSAQRNRTYCALACYAVFHKLFCMKKDDFLPIFWRCKTIFVTLHHQTRAVMPGAAGTGAGNLNERCRISTRKAADEDTKHKTLKYTDGQKCNY